MTARDLRASLKRWVLSAAKFATGLVCSLQFVAAIKLRSYTTIKLSDATGTSSSGPHVVSTALSSRQITDRNNSVPLQSLSTTFVLRRCVADFYSLPLDSLDCCVAYKYMHLPFINRNKS